MTPLTLEEIEAIERGCEGVTPGPWQYDRKSGDLMSADGKFVIEIIPYEEHYMPNQDGDCAHIANCDPDTIRRLCAMAKREGQRW